MKEVISKDKCCGCSACKNVCPVGAITMEEEKDGFFYPKINKDKCIDCGMCKRICPVLNTKENKNKPKTYACYNKDINVRKNSSSGGVFQALAEYIIDNGGVVFGATFDDDFMVKHIKIDTKEEIVKLRTSKYVQSYIGDTYKECKKILNSKRLVLFTGTPCQIEGLLSYLGKDYDNLYTQDIICHGVPSLKLWKNYLEYRKNKDKDNPLSINFRNKDNGWHNYNVKFTYKDKEYKSSAYTDFYMLLYLSDICLRESCYNCSFKKENRLSDITLADFWGIENVLSEMDDNNGTSIVFTRSKKGERLLECIKEKLNIKSIDYDYNKLNPSYNKSCSRPKERDNFIEEIDSSNFEIVANKYVKRPNLFERIIQKGKRGLNKLKRKK